MAPEAYRDERCTEKIDIYSLAMMMWEMLTGQLPWEGSNFQEVRNAVANLAKRPPIPPEIPQGISSVSAASLPLLPLLFSCLFACRLVNVVAVAATPPHPSSSSSFPPPLLGLPTYNSTSFRVKELTLLETILRKIECSVDDRVLGPGPRKTAVSSGGAPLRF